MSQTVWNIIGGLTILASILFFSRYPERLAQLPPDRHPQLIAGGVLFGLVLGVIASMCFLPKYRPITLRLLGFIGVAGCIFSLVDGFYRQNFYQFPIILLFWLPGSIYLVLYGKMD